MHAGGNATRRHHSASWLHALAVWRVRRRSVGGGGDASASRQGSNSMPVEKTVCAGIDLRRRSSEGTCEDACGERSADEVGESM